VPVGAIPLDIRSEGASHSRRQLPHSPTLRPIGDNRPRLRLIMHGR
jgi:hypothetical protein